MRERDSQRARVYRADRLLEARSTKLPQVKDVERFVKHAWGLKRLRDAYPKALGMSPPRVKDGRGCRNASGGYSSITIPLWARNAGVVCHELAHTILIREKGHKPAAHGWEFCAIFLDLVLYTLGRADHDFLKECFKKERVRFRPKRKRVLTDDQRAELRARFIKNAKEPVPGPELLAALLPAIG